MKGYPRRNLALLAGALGALACVLAFYPWGEPRIQERAPTAPDSRGEPAGTSEDVLDDGDSQRIASDPPTESQVGVHPDRRAFDLRLRTVWARSDEPAAGIEVQLQELGAHGMPRRTWSLRSDGAGEAFVGGLSTEGAYRVQARRGPWQDLSIPPAGTEHLLILRVDAAFPLLVRVLAPDGEPVAGALVLDATGTPGRERPDEERELGTTGADGTLHLEDILGIFALAARAPSYSPSPPQEIGWQRLLQAGPAGPIPLLELHLGRGGGALVLVVRDVDDQPVASARAELNPLEAGRTGLESRVPLGNSFTDAEGSLHLADLAPGPYLLKVSHGRAGSWSGPLEVGDGPSRTQIVRLTPHGAVEVRPRSGATGVAGASVAVGTAFGVWRGRTGEDGSLRLDGIPAGPVALRASHPDRGRAEEHSEVHPGQLLVWEPALDLGGVLAGVVRDARGGPCIGWQVLAHPSLPGLGEDRIREAVTDEGGSFRFVALALAPYHLEVRRDPIQPLPNGEYVDIRPTRTDLVLFVQDEPPTGILRGRVTGHRELGLSTLVALRSGTPSVELLPLDHGDGSFESGSLAPGLYSLSLSSGERDYPLGVEVDLQPGEVRDLGTISVPAPGTLEVHLVGTASAGAVRIQLQGLTSPTVQISADEPLSSGEHLVLESIPPGTYWLAAERGWIRLQGMQLEVQSGQHHIVQIAPDPHPAVHWLLEVENPAVPFYRLRLFDRYGALRLVAWCPGLHGATIRLEAALPAGPYECEIWGGGRLLDRFSTSIPEAQDPGTPLATWVLGN